jgi:hypothetical protein
MISKEEYEERKQAKIDYARKRANELRTSCDRVFERGFGENVTGIPFGQPILVGHHSERKHRNAIKKMDNQIKKALDDGNKSKYYLEKAKRMEENTVIRSDDPDAGKLLKEKLILLESKRERIKLKNKELRKEGKDTYPAYILSNLGQNISTVKKRIEQLEKNATRETKKYSVNSVRVVENTDENRIQLFYEGIPEVSVRDKLKSWGFRWSRYNGCWQRMLNGNGLYATKRVLEAES